MFQKKVVEKKHTLTLSNFSFFGNCAVYENVEKYCKAGQATDDNMAHAHCVLNN
jgi:hypothetical protein